MVDGVEDEVMGVGLDYREVDVWEKSELKAVLLVYTLKLLLVPSEGEA